jgi:putative ABC transport system substrate-binding protein
MKRRDFITLLGGAAAAWPIAARAQQAGVPVIGFLTLQGRTAGTTPQRMTAFRQGLSQLGYVEGKNVAIEYRFAEGRTDQLPALTIELVSRRVNVIFATDNAGVQVAKPASITIPIVFSIGADPVALGLVTSFNRPGGNITGVSFLSSAVMAKMLQFLHDAVPNVSSIALLVNPANPQAAIDTRDTQEAARTLGLNLLILSAGSDREIDAAFMAIVEGHAGALLVEGDGFLGDRRERIIALAARHALPAMFRGREHAEAGGLIAYGASITEADRQAGIYVGRILKGEKPADLPVQQATKVELVINLKTAKALGLTLSPDLLSIADEVIE